MQIGKRGFGTALQQVIPDFDDWRATYRWPFIALSLILSLGVIASGGAKRADAVQIGQLVKSPPALQTLSIPQNSSSRAHANDAERPAPAIDDKTTPIAPQQMRNEQAQR